MKWLQEEKLGKLLAMKLLQKTNRYILTFIVKPLIKHFYQPIRAIHGYKTTFVPRNIWCSFRDKVWYQMLKLGHLKNCKQGESRGTLKIMPKSSSCDVLNYRSYVICNKNKSHNKFYFTYLKKTIKKVAATLSSIGNSQLYEGWGQFTKALHSTNLFGIKVDIKDAFGHVDINQLCAIIKIYFARDDMLFIISHVNNQYVTFRKKLYKWEHGLLQGDPLSPSLCNLYIAYIESKHLLKYQKPHTFLHRVVDDYFYCSPTIEDINNFKASLTELFTLNESKTEYVLEETCSTLIYCGQIFDLSSKEVGRFFDFSPKDSLRYHFKIWNIRKPVEQKSRTLLVTSSLDFKNNNFYFKPMELNTDFNTEAKVLFNYFQGMIFIAYKFAVVADSLIEFGKKSDSIPDLFDVVEKSISFYSKICLNNIVLHKGKYFSGKIKFGLLFKLACNAFVLVLKRNYIFYQDLILKFESKGLFLNFEGINIDHRVFKKIPLALNKLAITRKTSI